MASTDDPCQRGIATVRRIARPSRESRSQRMVAAGIVATAARWRVEGEELRPLSLVDVPGEPPDCASASLAEPVDDPHRADRGRVGAEAGGGGGWGKPSGELPGGGDEVGGEVVAIVTAETRTCPAEMPPDDLVDVGLNVGDVAEFERAVEQVTPSVVDAAQSAAPPLRRLN